jgi:riboflavin biosynthesis pyrimidine reductase
MSQKSKVSSLKSARRSSGMRRTRHATLDLRLETQDCRLQDLRPFVLINMAMTADGKIATANGAVSSFGSVRDHEHLLELRATADAVMCGARTANAAAINLGPGAAKFRRLRLQRGLAEYNLRVLVSGSGSIDPCAEIFKHRPLTRPSATLSPSDGERDGVRGMASPIIILTTQRMSAASRQRLQEVGAEIKICGAKAINFRAALRWLHREWGVQRLLCEGGGELNDALFRAGLVDELNLTVCPKVFGGRTAPTIADGLGFPRLAKAGRLRLNSVRRVGEELFLQFRRR